MRNKQMVATAAVFMVIGAISLARAQEKRTWTAKSGHKVEATLLKYSDYEITLKLPGGQEKTFARTLFEEADTAYLKKFPKLWKKEKPAKMPFIRTKAVVGSRSRDTKYQKDHEAAKSFSIEVSSREQEPTEVVVRWIWVAKPNGRGTKGPGDMLYFGKREKKVKVGAQTSVTFNTGTGTARNHPGFELSGIIVQTYWDGFLIDHFSSLGALSSLAKDPGVWKRARR